MNQSDLYLLDTTKVNQNGFQYLQRVATGFFAKVPYYIRCKVRVVEDHHATAGTGDQFGFSTLDHNGQLEWIYANKADSVNQQNQNY